MHAYARLMHGIPVCPLGMPFQHFSKMMVLACHFVQCHDLNVFQGKMPVMRVVYGAVIGPLLRVLTAVTGALHVQNLHISHCLREANA